MKKTYLVIGILMAGILLSGCIQPSNGGSGQIVGGDTDEHGCIPSAGYTWCEAKQKCLREWEEACEEEAPLIGGDRDEHGCIPSAGYTWCEAKQKCLRPWEEECEAASWQQKIEERANEFCGQENVANVFTCGEYIKVVSSLIGGGSAYYKFDLIDGIGSIEDGIHCPVVAPSAMSDECVLLTMGSNCVEEQIC